MLRSWMPLGDETDIEFVWRSRFHCEPEADILLVTHFHRKSKKSWRF